jgi:hypothetical protein
VREREEAGLGRVGRKGKQAAREKERKGRREVGRWWKKKKEEGGELAVWAGKGREGFAFVFFSNPFQTFLNQTLLHLFHNFFS